MDPADPPKGPRTRTAWEICAELDLGPGGYAAGPARESREVLRRLIVAKRKARRSDAD